MKPDSPESLNRNLTQVIHRSSPVRRRNKAPGLTTAAEDSAKRGFAAAGEGREQAVELAAAEFRAVAFGGETGDGARNDAALDFGGRVGGAVEDFRSAADDGPRPLLLRRPLECGLGFADIGGAARQGLRVEPVGFGERAANADALELFVLVARIARGLEAGGCADLLELGTAPAEQWAEQRNVAAGDDSDGNHTGKAAHAGAAGEAHQQGFGLIVEMMRGGDGVELPLLRPMGEQAIAFLSGTLQDRGGGLLVPLHDEDRVRGAEARADVGDHLGFLAAAGAECVV